MTLCMLWHREDVEWVLRGANQIKVLQTGSEKLKPVPSLCFYYRARKLSDPARDRFSFNYVFHVCVPRVHAQRLLSRPNLSHTSSSPTPSSLPIKTGLHRVCLALVCMCFFYASVQCMCSLYVSDISQNVSSGTCHVVYPVFTVQCGAEGT